MQFVTMLTFTFSIWNNHTLRSWKVYAVFMHHSHIKHSAAENMTKLLPSYRNQWFSEYATTPPLWTHLSSSVSFCRPFWVTPIRSSSNCITLAVASSSLLFTSSFSSCKAWEEFCTSWETIKYNDGNKWNKTQKQKTVDQIKTWKKNNSVW